MSTTKVAARQAILKGLGRGGVATTTGGGSTSTLVCVDYKSTVYQADYFDNAWFHVPTATAPKQRRAKDDALAPGSGTITVDDVFGSIIATSTQFEWSPLMPLISGAATGDGPSIEDCLYEALRHLVFPDEITQAITTTNDIPITGVANVANWLDRSDRLVQVLEPNPFAAGGELVDSSFRDWKLILDGETPKLRFSIPFSSATGNLTLRVLRPADTWFKTGGGVTWSEVTPGTALAAETDEVKPDLVHIREAGLVFALQALWKEREGPRRGEYHTAFLEQLAVARDLPFWDHTRDDLVSGQSDQGKAA